jgi:pilus assembly protein CpaC
MARGIAILKRLGAGALARVARGSSNSALIAMACALAIAFMALPATAQTSKPAPKPQKQENGIYHVEAQAERIDVKVTLHKTETIRVAYPFTEALVGNAEVADVVPLTNRSIYIVGKKVGVTRLTLLDQDKQLLGIVDVEVTYDLAALRSQIRRSELNGVKVSSVNGKLLLTGVAQDAVAMQQVLVLAEQIAPGDVTNAMKVAAPQQVLLEVRFIEADRTASRALGVNATVVGDRAVGVTGVESNSGGIGVGSDGDFVNGLVNNLAGGLASNAVPFGALVGRVLAGGTTADIFVKALEEKGLARRLAEPNLVALSGDTASFLAGGEFPFPVSAENDKISVEFKKFGIGLAFTPTVLNAGQINLKIEPEVSELDASNFIRVSKDVEIPTLIVRRASTTVELRDGQSFAIAGLLQSSHVKNQRQLPWLGDVPVLGALLRSAAWQKKETDLVIIVTPRLVKPRVPGQKLVTPLDSHLPSNDEEFFLDGRQEVKVGRPRPQTGHIIDWRPEQPVSEGFKK